MKEKKQITKKTQHVILCVFKVNYKTAPSFMNFHFLCTDLSRQEKFILSDFTVCIMN